MHFTRHLQRSTPTPSVKPTKLLTTVQARPAVRHSHPPARVGEPLPAAHAKPVASPPQFSSPPIRFDGPPSAARATPMPADIHHRRQPTSFGSSGAQPKAVPPGSRVAAPALPTHFHPAPAVQAKSATFAPRRPAAPPLSAARLRSPSPAAIASPLGQVVQCIKSTPVSYATSPFSKEAREIRSSQKVGGRNIATIEFKILSTNVVERHSEISDGVHSEKLIYDWLEANHHNDYKAIFLYTEYEPCGSDFHNCNDRVSKWFPGVDVYYSIIYPSMDTVSDDESNIEDSGTKTIRKKTVKERQNDRIEKAKRRRHRATNVAKRIETLLKARKKNSIPLDKPINIDKDMPKFTTPKSPKGKDDKGSGFWN